MQSHFARVVLFSLTIALFGLWSEADDITRISSKIPLRGTISDENSREIVIQVKQGASGKDFNVPLNDIKIVNYDGSPGLALRQGRTFEAAGQYDRAIEAYSAPQQDASEFATQALEFSAIRSAAQKSLETESGQAAAISALEGFATKYGNSRHQARIHELTGRLQLESKNMAAARAAFARLSESVFEEDKMQAQIWEGQILLREKKFAEASTLFKSILTTAAKSPAAKLRLQLATLLQGESLMEQKKFDEAESLLRKVIKETDGEATSIQAPAHNTLGDILRTAGKTEDALLAYLYVDLICPTDRQEHPRALYNLVQIGTELGKQSIAAQAKEKLGKLYPGSPWLAKTQ